jgi:hypothetical protein
VIQAARSYPFGAVSAIKVPLSFLSIPKSLVIDCEVLLSREEEFPQTVFAMKRVLLFRPECELFGHVKHPSKFKESEAQRRAR